MSSESPPMSRQLPRFTVRRLMAFVAIVGIAFWAIPGLLHVWRLMNNPYYDDPRYIGLMRNLDYRRSMAEKHARIAARSVGEKRMFHVEMEAKWRDAAMSPGRAVEPDPPEPQ